MSKKKWISPLQSMLANDAKDTLTVEELASKKALGNKDKIEQVITIAPNQANVVNINDAHDAVLLVDPSRIKNWELHDRTEHELGDLDALGQDMKANGQQQPCIVRPTINDPEHDYELIAGERRWRASILYSLKLLVIVKNLSDKEAAISQISENCNRKDLSDYSRGMNYAKLIEKGILSQKDLEKKLNLSKAAISRLLSFSQVPSVIWDAVGDVTKVSARTAAEIRSYANKGQEYVTALISLADKIRSGRLGEKALSQEIEAIISGQSNKLTIAEEVRNTSGRHLFTWRRDSNNNLSVSFPKDIRKLIDREKLEEVIKAGIEIQLSELNKNS